MLQKMSFGPLLVLTKKRLFSRLAVLCPGQGSQFIGLFPNNDKYSNFFDKDISKCASTDYVTHVGNNGPINVLNKTVNCQPAVVLSSMFTYEHLKESKIKNSTVDCIAGYSVGEISALYIAGLLSYEDVLNLVQGRAEAMQYASDLKETGMISMQGLSYQQAAEMCDDLNRTRSGNNNDEIIHVAIETYPKCVVLGGSANMLNKVIGREHEFLKEECNVKLSILPVSGAFHTKYMQPAQERFHKVLDSLELAHTGVSTTCLLYSNVTGKPYTEQDDLKSLLVRQLCEPVQWASILEDICMKFDDGRITHLYEVGPGRQLKTMIGKVNRKAVRRTESVHF